MENRGKRPGLQKKKIIFHQNKASAHKSVSTMAKFNELIFHRIHQIWPLLASAFSHLLKIQAWKVFLSNNEFIETVDEYFANLEKLKEHWSKSIEPL